MIIDLDLWFHINIWLTLTSQVIIAAATPNNVWETGTYKFGYDRFFYYAW